MPCNKLQSSTMNSITYHFDIAIAPTPTPKTSRHTPVLSPIREAKWRSTILKKSIGIIGCQQ